MFLFCKRSIPPLGYNQPSNQWVPWALSPEVRRPATEADQSLPHNAGVKNEWRCDFIPPHAFKACKDELQSYPTNTSRTTVLRHQIWALKTYRAYTAVSHIGKCVSMKQTFLKQFVVIQTLKICPAFTKRKCNSLLTINCHQTVSWTNSMQLHLTTELSNEQSIEYCGWAWCV
jgi:hypothetical protein